MSTVIFQAIRNRQVLAFEYEGHHRVLAPYCHGTNSRGNEVLRAVQLAGTSKSGGFGFGKLWLVGNMFRLHLTDARFSPDDPNYNPKDSAMVRIHCHV